MYRVFLADDHAMFREGLKLMLRSDRDVAVVGEAEDGDQAAARIAALRPEIAVLDVALPKLNGIDVVRRVVAAGLPTRCIMLTMHEEAEIALSALNAGAMGYILKGHTFDELRGAIDTIASGRKFISPLIAESVLDAATRQKGRGRLTRREEEILAFIAKGFSNRKIAGLLRLSEKTVHTHKSRIMDKLDIHSTAELVRFAILDKGAPPA
jgi:DNA-binding NarL/FixJ family response regulator